MIDDKYVKFERSYVWEIIRILYVMCDLRCLLSRFKWKDSMGKGYLGSQKRVSRLGEIRGRAITTDHE